MTFDFIQLFLGIFALYYASSLLIDSGSLLASKYNIPKVVIGLTLIAFGTSLPEFIVSMVAIYNEKIDIVTGNILGSNIANIGLVLGLSAFLYKLTCDFRRIKLDIVFLSISSIAFSFILYSNIVFQYNSFEKVYGLIFLILFFIYIYILFNTNRTNVDISDSLEEDKSVILLIIYILIGSIGLSIGSHLLINGAIKLASYFHIPELVIGATAIALGTSLPELATSLNAAKKNEFELLLGNIFGSNIINIAFVFGCSLIINDNPVNLLIENLFDLSIFLLVTFSLIIALVNNKIYRLYGLFLLTTYIIYIYRIL